MKVLIGVVTDVGLYEGPTKVNMYGNTPPDDTVACNTPLLWPHVVPVVDALTVYRFVELIDAVVV